MPEEREQLVAVLQQPRPQGLGRLGPEGPGRQVVEEADRGSLVPPQVACLQTVPTGY
jgi:hypothetical protein